MQPERHPRQRKTRLMGSASEKELSSTPMGIVMKVNFTGAGVMGAVCTISSGKGSMKAIGSTGSTMATGLRAGLEEVDIGGSIGRD